MIGLFFGAMFMGHIYIIAIVTAVQIISFKEVIAIANVPSRARRLRFTKALNWYWLATTMYFLYGESVIYYFKHIVLVDKVLLPFATHHRFISFMLYVIGKNPEHLRYIQGLMHGRIRLFCCISSSRALPLPIHAVCMDTYGIILDRGSGAFYHEQCFRRHDLVLPSSIPGHLQ
jgi:phosphatidate cytidylyltransferase